MNQFGELQTCTQQGGQFHITFAHQILTVTWLSEGIINIFAGPGTYRSRAVILQPEADIQVTQTWEDKVLVLTSHELVVRIHDDGYIDVYDCEGNLLVADYRGQRSGFARHGVSNVAEAEGHKVQRETPPHQIEVLKAMQGDECFYGLGDKTGFLNKRGYAYEMWNTDDPSPHVESHKALYKSVPFLVTLQAGRACGLFFDNTFKTYFDLGKENAAYYYFGADEGSLNYYFVNGPSIQSVLANYTALTGRTPLPQLWTLGYQQSRWSYETAERAKAIVQTFREQQIPLDVLHLDIDYMDQFKVFTWDQTRFPDPAAFVADLASEGVKVVTIIDPAIKKAKGYFAFDEGIEKRYFVTDRDGVTYINQVWPGDAAFPDFSHPAVRTWWASHIGTHVNSGLAGIWNDMNEPASFQGELPADVQFANDGQPSTHAELHNVYGHLMCEATYEGLKAATQKRPFVITRGAYAGTQRYSTFWTGDNHSFWEHLRLAIPQQLNLGMSGFALVGTDVGGFGSDTTAELLIRWTQLGAFSPLFRNHSSIFTRSQEPFAFDKQTCFHVRAAIQLRYRLLPYFYDLLWELQTTGLPVLRPLIMHYQTDQRVTELNTQFMLGSQLIVAPVLEQGARERSVYLPEGTWFDYWRGTVQNGGMSFICQGALGDIPMFAKAGSILPHYPSQNYIGETVITELTLALFCGQGSYDHFEDDGESFAYEQGAYKQTRFTLTPTTLQRTSIHDGYQSHYETYALLLIGMNPTVVHVDGQALACVPTPQGTSVIVPADFTTVSWE